MSGAEPKLVTCPGCGDDVPARALRLHVCDWGRWLDHQIELRSDELRRFETDLGVYLASPRGRFDLWYAERERSGRGPWPTTA
jgi:hypothetical protein